MHKTDEQWMRRALQLARRAWGRTSPNPLVGALLVRDGREVGGGYHRQAGTPHAEVHALAAAGELARGATLYVTLEPCSTHGRTPPCTAAILAAGVARVVIGCLDANPAHAGRAVELLRRQGVEVDSGILEAACRELNEAFFHWITTGRPFVLLKMAMTLDGKIATRDGQSQWITGPAARREVQKWRRWADAIMVGGETVRLDNPALTVRQPANWPCQPRLVVWTRRPALPTHLQLCQDAARPPLLASPASRDEWLDLLRQLGAEAVVGLLLEGGGRLAGAALQAGIVDRILFFVAPKILGGANSRPVVGGFDPGSLAEALPLRDLRVRRLGDDLAITGCPC